MAGRIKRKAGLAAAAALAERAAAPATCALCGRPLGQRTEWHHAVPKSEGGRDTVPVHPICHRTIHASATNAELARDRGDLDALRAREPVARFLAWIADKPPDFHAPTRGQRRGIEDGRRGR
jgi:5-methylcytosine-specific restriction endonuclease McrA